MGDNGPLKLHTKSLHSYDLLHNQVVLCSEKCTNLAKVTTILSHELVHMYDNCVAKVDWSNKHHLACSEVNINKNIIHLWEYVHTIFSLDPCGQPRPLFWTHLRSSGGWRFLDEAIKAARRVCQEEGGEVSEGYPQM